MSWFSLAALALVLAYAAFQRAGVALDDWSLCLVATGVVCALHFAIAKGRDVPKLDRWTLFSSGAFLAIAALQLVPLPVTVLRALSPARVELLEAAAPFTGGMPAFTTITAVPYNTAVYVATLLGYVAVFLLVRDISFRTRAMPWAVAWPLLAVASLEAVLGFYQSYAAGGAGIASGTYDNRDHFAGLLEMALPFAALYPAAILQRRRHRYESPAAPALKACAMLLAAAVLLAGIIHSLSRMGFIVALATLFVSASVAASLRGWRVDYEVRSARWRRWAPTLLVAAAVLLGFVFLPTDPLIARFSEFATTDAISADTRAQIWRDTAGLVKAYPLTGCGLGAYPSCFYKFKTVAPMSTVDYAHNDYLQVLAEMGVVGFVAGLLFILRVLERAFRGAVHARSVDQRYLAIACLASIAGILLHSFVDFNMYVPANGYAFAWVLGIAGLNLREPAPRASVRYRDSEGEPAMRPAG